MATYHAINLPKHYASFCENFMDNIRACPQFNRLLSKWPKNS